MSAYENIVGGRLRLKGKALHVKVDGISNNKKKRHKHRHASLSHQGENTGLPTNRTTEEDLHETDKDGSDFNAFEDHLTPAERKFLQQTHELELRTLAKMASKSHHDRIQEFNQYWANLTEHYDIPKVGPG
ncbi:protein FAM32A-like [Durio zibethinus]|uniref:Protein FAM32A-like n=1 Tax=Durio zibethinus TaxID=66656 RepID=A0A6P5XM14_DURZI|nr:protein FAM32A-like [Durio zibethinus]